MTVPQHCDVKLFLEQERDRRRAEVAEFASNPQEFRRGVEAIEAEHQAALQRLAAAK